MSHVADQFREETRRKTRALPILDRIQLAFELGDADAAVLAAAKGLTLAEAKTVIARSRAVGRQPSCANDR